MWLSAGLVRSVRAARRTSDRSQHHYYRRIESLHRRSLHHHFCLYCNQVGVAIIIFIIIIITPPPPSSPSDLDPPLLSFPSQFSLAFLRIRYGHHQNQQQQKEQKQQQLIISTSFNSIVITIIIIVVVLKPSIDLVFLAVAIPVLAKLAVHTVIITDLQITVVVLVVIITEVLVIVIKCFDFVPFLLFVFLYRQLRQGRHQRVLVNLAVSMLLSWVVFLAGFERVESHVGCLAVAALLHYLILASFLWMLMEGVLAYLLFVKVFGTPVSHYMVKASLFAWGKSDSGNIQVGVRTGLDIVVQRRVVSEEVQRRPKSQEVGDERGRLYLSNVTQVNHHQNDSCIKMCSVESRFNVSLIVRDKVRRQCPGSTPFEEGGEQKRNRTEVLLLISLTARSNVLMRRSEIPGSF